MSFLLRRVGWIRLWAMTCIIAAGFFAAYAAKDFPLREPIVEGYEMSMGVTVEEQLLMRNLNKILPEDMVTKAVVEADLAAWKQKRKQETDAALAALPGEQFQYIALWTGAWIAFCLSMRLAGEMVSWVIRGFRSPTHN